jgi:hypothetical protein
MTREETFETFVMKFILFQDLLDNAHSIDPEDVANAIVDCLPTELAQFKGGPYMGTAMVAPQESCPWPRPLPKAPAVLPKSQSQDPAADQTDPDRKKSRKVRCESRGHVSKECTKWKKGAEDEQAGEKSEQPPPSVAYAPTSDHVPSLSHPATLASA